MSPLDSSKMTGTGLLIPMPLTMPRGSLTTRIVTPPAWLTDVLAQWLAQHLPATDNLDALVIFTDTRPLDKVGAWKYTKRLWQHRFSRQGPHHERWRGLYVPLTSETGLAEVQCTWGEVFVAEAIAALRPTWHLLLSDTDVAPTALFEVNELVDLCKHLMHEELSFGEPGILIGTEPHQDINAGMAIFMGTQTTPASWLPLVQNLCSSTRAP